MGRRGLIEYFPTFRAVWTDVRARPFTRHLGPAAHHCAWLGVRLLRQPPIVVAGILAWWATAAGGSEFLQAQDLYLAWECGRCPTDDPDRLVAEMTLASLLFATGLGTFPLLCLVGRGRPVVGRHQRAAGLPTPTLPLRARTRAIAELILWPPAVCLGALALFLFAVLVFDGREELVWVVLDYWGRWHYLAEQVGPHAAWLAFAVPLMIAAGLDHRDHPFPSVTATLLLAVVGLLWTGHLGETAARLGWPIALAVPPLLLGSLQRSVVRRRRPRPGAPRRHRSTARRARWGPARFRSDALCRTAVSVGLVALVLTVADVAALLAWRYSPTMRELWAGDPARGAWAWENSSDLFVIIITVSGVSFALAPLLLPCGLPPRAVTGAAGLSAFDGSLADAYEVLPVRRRSVIRAHLLLACGSISILLMCMWLPGMVLDRTGVSWDWLGEWWRRDPADLLAWGARGASLALLLGVSAAALTIGRPLQRWATWTGVGVAFGWWPAYVMVRGATYTAFEGGTLPDIPPDAFFLVALLSAAYVLIPLLGEEHLRRPERTPAR